MRKILLAAVTFVTLTACAHTPQENPQQQAVQVFSDKPYTVNLEKLSALDPKPLQVESFSPDPSPLSQGLRIVSTGRIFPFTYDIISIAQQSNPDLLRHISNSFNDKEDIILKEEGKSDSLGDYIHFYQRFSESGKPHHVSSNYLFIKNNVFYHLSVSNYSAKVTLREQWGLETPDDAAEQEAQRLLAAISFK